MILIKLIQINEILKLIKNITRKKLKNETIDKRSKVNIIIVFILSIILFYENLFID